MTDTRQPVDLRSIRSLAEGAAAAAKAALERLDLPEDSEVVGLLRVARAYAQKILSSIPEADQSKGS